MKILFLNHNVKGKGTYIRCFNFAKHLVRFGHSVVILASADKPIFKIKKEVINGVEVVCMPEIMCERIRNGGLGPIDTILRCLYLLDKKFDIIENFDHRPAVLYPALLGKYLFRTFLVSEWTDLHGTGGSLDKRPFVLQNLIRPYEDLTECKSKKIAERLIVISNGLRDKAIKLGFSKSKITRIPGGADTEKILPKTKEEARKIFKLPLDKKIIAYTAGTHYDVDLLLKSIYLIQRAQKDVLLITTGDMFGSKLKKYAYDPKRIIEFGFLPYEKYVALLPSADIFLFPFENKSINRCRWPNKIGDYMAAGRPTVSNRTGDIISLFEKHKIGSMASDNPEDMAAKTILILNNNELSCTMGNNARHTAEQHYDWGLLSKKLEVCFLEVIKEGVQSNDA